MAKRQQSPATPIDGEQPPASERIRQRLTAAGKRFHANDNIAAFIEPGEVEQLLDEVQAQMAGVLRALVIDTDSDHNTQDTARRVAKMYLNEIFRGRYFRSFAQPAPLTPGKVEHYQWTLPNVNHVFLPGHRIMVQVQSTLFPLYDRNPQTYVDNIMYAKPDDYRKATQSIAFGGAQASAVVLPVVP